jgi:two-component system LytT family sensor kinase
LFLHAFRKTDLWVPLYLLLASVSHAVLFSRNLRERERRVSDLERRLMESQADLLRLQLEPHFLFNTLNAIGTLVYRDAGLADDLISQLATLLRRLLDLRDVHFIPLRDELDVLRAYLAIERARFGDRLRCEERIEPSALDYPVPVLLLQPLAENAVRHGIEPLGRSGTLVYSAAVEPDGVLVLAIEDDGVGFREDATVPDRSTGGIGIRNVRSRIEVLYGPRASVKMTPRPGGGVRVTIRIPPLSNLSPASSS